MMNSDEDSSFKVLETSDCMPTPTMVMETKEPVENLGAHSDNLVKILKDEVDQLDAQEKPLDFSENPEVPENPEENEDQRIVKVFISQVILSFFCSKISLELFEI